MNLPVAIAFFTLMCFAANAHAGESSAPDSAKTVKHRKYKFELDYSHNHSYRGRKDTTTGDKPLLSPLFKYTARSGFFTRFSLVDVPGTSKLFDELDAGLGWNFNFSDKWDGGLSFEHYFFDKDVKRIKSAVQNDIGLSTGFDSKILYTGLTFDLMSGQPKKLSSSSASKTIRQSDINIDFSNTHDFDIELKNNKLLSLSPELDILAGTQKLLATSGSDKKSMNFSLTAYICYFNILYHVNKWNFKLSPNYTIPQNTLQGQYSKPYFIMSAGISYTIKT